MIMTTLDDLFYKENNIYTTTSYDGDDIFLSSLLKLYDVYLDYYEIKLGDLREWYFEYDKLKIADMANKGFTPEQILNSLWNEYLNEAKSYLDSISNIEKGM